MDLLTSLIWYVNAYQCHVWVSSLYLEGEVLLKGIEPSEILQNPQVRMTLASSLGTVRV